MILRKEQLNDALAALAADTKVLVPTTEAGVTKYVVYGPDVQPDFALVNTTLPPKDALFPQTQKMFRFKKGGVAELEEVVESDEQIVFGMRPCDVASVRCLDQVFLTKTFVDSFYGRKRDALTMVAMGCTEAKETCFCTSMGQKPDEAPLADVLLTPTAEGYNLAAQSDKGEALVQKLQAVLQQGEGQPLAAAEPSLVVDMEGVPETLATLFEDPMWDEVFRPCLTCGTCTFACPTCYCFEFEAMVKGDEGEQHRCWDSCMFSEYTRMAGGHNPRPSNKERVRNRYMHKLSFFEERYGNSLCVGCGRCIEECPVGMDITRIIEMAQARKEQAVCSNK